MTLLVLGIVLWIAAHLLKRVAPSVRRGIRKEIGNGRTKALLAATIMGSVGLMIIGYRLAPVVPVYTPLPGMGHVNNVLMLVSIILFGFSASKGRTRGLLRHPMLWGVVVWSVAHLLVNGDMRAIVLFGSMAVWALVEMVVINAREKNWKRPKPGTPYGDLRVLVISAIVFGIMAAVHIFVGVNPFLGTYG